MLIHQLPLDAAFAALRSTPTGLPEADAAARRAEFGPNRIERLPSTPLPLRFLRQFTHFLAVLLWVAALLALVADWWMPGQGMRTLAVAIVAVVVINGAFSFWQEYRAEETMAALQRLLPHQVKALRDRATVVIPSEDVVPGDVIFVTAGDDVPADCRLIEGFGVRVNNATVTGEARPVSRDGRPSPEADLLRSRNVLLAGTSVIDGALVDAAAAHTAPFAVLAVDLGTDMMPALGLGAEPPDAQVMQRPPRARHDRLLSPGLLVRAYLFLGSIEAAAAMAAFAFVLLGGGWRWGAELTATDGLYRQATTACLTTIVMMQVMNVHLCRSRRRSSFGRPLFDNRLITTGIVAELAVILLIDYTAAGNALFGTAPPGYQVWLAALPFAAAMLALEEVRKAVVRRRDRIRSSSRHPLEPTADVSSIGTACSTDTASAGERIQ